MPGLRGGGNADGMLMGEGNGGSPPGNRGGVGSGASKGLAFVRSRAAGQLWGEGLGREGCVRGFFWVVASAFSVTSLSPPREWVGMGLRREVKV